MSGRNEPDINAEISEISSNRGNPDTLGANCFDANNKDCLNLSNGQLKSDDQEAVSLPKYTNYFKFLLVEELALLDDICKIHYGRCTVIGRLQFVSVGYILENIRLTQLPKEYQLPEGACTIRLDFDCNASKQLGKVQLGNYCEVLGEVILMPKENRTKEFDFMRRDHLHELINFIGNSSEDLSEEQEKKRNALISYYQNNYEPVIRTCIINSISRPSELITRNLELRDINL